MDFMKAIEFDKFLLHKHQRTDIEFPVKVYVFQNPGNRNLQFDSNIMIENNIGKDDYVLTFMNDMLRTYIGGFVQMWVGYLDNVKFDGQNLCFTTSNGIDIELN